ncbi:alpha/beta hydrolase [Alpinimonas psychrophila]|uniref:Pimeloyl-ACP methyl ester carboxylesterase n=1 Tax=Alpinimonas psychrophila TaxID=748908 RepID=A0A7W3JU23_9MICO|nr:alpha/beta hydrolase [Alpinimonas psychrophila]MBA8829102.1 pimeloyl-ACP methyl ester carboxylesterase [Alpinimonas psychrophila]
MRRWNLQLSLRSSLAVALSTTLLVGLSACIPSFPNISVDMGTRTAEKLDPAVASFYEQQLTWGTCAPDAAGTPVAAVMQCTRVSAPIDWAKPAGETVSLALIRHESTKKNSLGSLFVNPGGPGGSGLNFIRDSLDYAVGKPLQESYDIVGFDPRGVGQSTPVTCYTDPTQTDDLLYGLTPAARGSDEWIAAREASARDFAAACAANTGALLAHVDTVSAAKDLDMLRYALGNTHLNYLGYSYGTLLGATYADLFPTHVGRMVLDGALDPSSSGADVTLTQAVGFENALRSYLAWCLSQTECPVAGDGNVDSALADITALLANIDTNPILPSGTETRTLGADTVVTAIIAPLYDKTAWSYLSTVLAAAQARTAAPVFESADWYNGRDGSGTYRDNSTEAFLAINCLDYPASADVASWRTDAAALSASAPVIGPYFGFGDATCANWPYPATRTPAPIAAVGSPDILVIGTTGDPATPYQWAVNLSGQLSRGHLVSYAGEGHTAYNKSNSCVDDAVVAFFVSSVVPATDPKC